MYNEEEENCLNAFDRRDRKSSFEMLLQLSCDPAKLKGPTNQTLLHLSARNGWLDVTKLLVNKYHCDPFSEDDAGFSVLHHACTSGNLDVVVYVVHNWYLEIDPKKRAKNGFTPLDHSEKTGDSDIIHYLRSVVGKVSIEEKKRI